MMDSFTAPEQTSHVISLITVLRKDKFRPNDFCSIRFLKEAIVTIRIRLNNWKILPQAPVF